MNYDENRLEYDYDFLKKYNLKLNRLSMYKWVNAFGAEALDVDIRNMRDCLHQDKKSILIKFSEFKSTEEFDEVIDRARVIAKEQFAKIRYELEEDTTKNLTDIEWISRIAIESSKKVY
jgi:hypothetical protein